MNRPRNTLGLLAPFHPPQPNALEPYSMANALLDWRPKTEYVPGYYRTVDLGILGYSYEWVPGYWRRRAW